jgi:acetoacetyl-CoA synthetase
LLSSDGVLNPSGVHFCLGKIYGMLECPVFSEHIDDTIYFGQRRSKDKDERVLLFVKMHAGQKLDSPFEKAVNGKKVEIAINQVYISSQIEENKGLERDLRLKS